jgi:hypothetical protein
LKITLVLDVERFELTKLALVSLLVEVQNARPPHNADAYTRYFSGKAGSPVFGLGSTELSITGSCGRLEAPEMGGSWPSVSARNTVGR